MKKLKALTEPEDRHTHYMFHAIGPKEENSPVFAVFIQKDAEHLTSKIEVGECFLAHNINISLTDWGEMIKFTSKSKVSVLIILIATSTKSVLTIKTSADPNSIESVVIEFLSLKAYMCWLES